MSLLVTIAVFNSLFLVVWTTVFAIVGTPILGHYEKSGEAVWRRLLLVRLTGQFSILLGFLAGIVSKIIYDRLAEPRLALGTTVTGPT